MSLLRERKPGFRKQERGNGRVRVMVASGEAEGSGGGSGGGPGPLQLAAVKFTFGVDPIHRAFRGTLLFEVNFTG